MAEKRFRIETIWDEKELRFVRSMRGECSKCGDSAFNWQLNGQEAELVCIRCGYMIVVHHDDIDDDVHIGAFNMLASQVSKSMEEEHRRRRELTLLIADMAIKMDRLRSEMIAEMHKILGDK